MPLPFSYINPERQRGSGKPAHGSNLLQTFLGWERSLRTAAETFTGGAENCCGARRAPGSGVFTGGAASAARRTGVAGGPVVDSLPASLLCVQSQIALLSAHAGVAADIRPLGVPAPPGAPPCRFLCSPPRGASLQSCSPAQTAAARCRASPAKLHPPLRTSPSKAGPAPPRAAAAVSHPCFVKHTLCRFRPHLPVAMGVFSVDTSRDSESLDFELQIVGVGVSAELPGRMEGALASILTFLLKELAEHPEFSLWLVSGPLSLRGEKFFRKVSAFSLFPGATSHTPFSPLE